MCGDLNLKKGKKTVNHLGDAKVNKHLSKSLLRFNQHGEHNQMKSVLVMAGDLLLIILRMERYNNSSHHNRDSNGAMTLI